MGKAEVEKAELEDISNQLNELYPKLKPVPDLDKVSKLEKEQDRIQDSLEQLLESIKTKQAQIAKRPRWVRINARLQNEINEISEYANKLGERNKSIEEQIQFHKQAKRS